MPEHEHYCHVNHLVVGSKLVTMGGTEESSGSNTGGHDETMDI